MDAKDKAREERLAAALRENLRRRKAQSREMDCEKHDTAAESQFRSGAALLDGPNTGSNWQQAVDLIHAAALAGHPEALASRALFECRGVAGSPDWEKALDSLAMAAEGGSQFAARQLIVLAEDRYEEAIADFNGSWNEIRSRIPVEQRLVARAGRTLSSSPPVVAIPEMASAAECQWLIASAQPRLQRAEVYQTGVNEGRTNEFALFDFGHTDVIAEMIRTRIARTLGAPLPFLEISQVLHYDVGQEFVLHCDFLDPQAQRDEIERHGQRVATFIIYLNEDYEGGATSFPRLGLNHRAKTGDGLLFGNTDSGGRPDARSQHAGCPPTRGEKWVFSQWIRNRAPT